MTWTLPHQEYEVYARNTLRSTTVELRFFPIFRIAANGADWASFQEKVRERFPRYKPVDARGWERAPTGDPWAPDELEHHFLEAESDNALILGQTTLKLSLNDHKSRKDLILVFNEALAALKDVFGHVEGQRLGLRYLNVIDKTMISEASGQETPWSDLVSTKFLAMPSNLVELSGAQFHTEIDATIPGKPGCMTLRYGLTGKSDSADEHFVFDIDRYVEKPPAGALDISAIDMEDMTHDVYALFHQMVGDGLASWLKGE